MEMSEEPVPTSKQKETIEPESDVSMGSFKDAVEGQELEESSEARSSLRRDGRKRSKKGKEPEVESTHSKEKSSRK